MCSYIQINKTKCQIGLSHQSLNFKKINRVNFNDKFFVLVCLISQRLNFKQKEIRLVVLLYLYLNIRRAIYCNLVKCVN